MGPREWLINGRDMRFWDCITSNDGADVVNWVAINGSLSIEGPLCGEWSPASTWSEVAVAPSFTTCTWSCIPPSLGPYLNTTSISLTPGRHCTNTQLSSSRKRNLEEAQSPTSTYSFIAIPPICPTSTTCALRSSVSQGHQPKDAVCRNPNTRQRMLGSCLPLHSRRLLLVRPPLSSTTPLTSR